MRKILKVANVILIASFALSLVRILPFLPAHADSTNNVQLWLPPPSDPNTQWKAGTINPWISAQYAQSISMSIQIPNSNPLSDEWYAVIISVFDNNGSYDQLGFANTNGVWNLAYGWSAWTNQGVPTYHDYEGPPGLSAGTTYTFNITARSDYTVNFAVYQGTTQVWSQTCSTGGNSLVLANTVTITGQGWYAVCDDYTDYEEVLETHTAGGAPNFIFNFYHQQWVSTNGTTYVANSWNSYEIAGNGYTVPSIVAVGINGDSVTVDNHPPNDPTLSGPQTVARNVQYQYTTNAVTDPDFGDQIRYHLKVTGPGPTIQETSNWLSSGTPTWWYLTWGPMDNAGSYLLQTWVEDLVGQLSTTYSLSVNLVDPVCAMKTNCTGWFYVPAVAANGSLKIEEWYDNENITGDQAGGNSPYPSLNWWPDGNVDGKDIAKIAKAFGLAEGQTGWNYMADVVPDKKIDGKDIAVASLHFGNAGTYTNYASNLGITVTFNTGQPISPDANGFVAIPQYATNFTVKQNGNPIGALITFWNTTVT